MESFVVAVAPPQPRLNVSATGDDLKKSPQLYFQGSDIVWMLISSGLVFLMVPAMCLFYSGASNRRSSLTLFRLPLITAALIGFEWYLWGYTLAFSPAVAPPSPNVSWYGWDSGVNVLHDALARPVGTEGGKIPELLYEFYEGMFASFTAALVCGGTIRDVHTGRFLVFITLWSLLVYIPVARWSWHWAGWSNQYGVMDFAGGTAVHITSGTTVLAFYVFYQLDKKGPSECLKVVWTILWDRLSIPSNTYKQLRRQFRRSTTVGTHGGAPSVESGDHDSEQHEMENRPQTEDGQKVRPAVDPVNDPEAGIMQQPLGRLGLGPEVDEPPHNVNNMVLGTALLWFGWLGFNGGSALGGNMRAVSACVSTHVAACAGGTTSLLFFWIWNALYRLSLNDGEDEVKVPSVTHFCDGAVIGLVAITPAAGFVPAWSSGIFGVVAAVAVFLFKQLTKKMLSDEPLHIFAIHTGGGMVGMFLTGVFASSDVVGLDGYSTILPRTMGGRLRYQMLDAFMGLFYTFFVTLAILYSLKVVRSIFRRKWSAGFKDPKEKRRWTLEALPQHAWRDTTQ